MAKSNAYAIIDPSRSAPATSTSSVSIFWSDGPNPTHNHGGIDGAYRSDFAVCDDECITKVVRKRDCIDPLRFVISDCSQSSARGTCAL